MIVIIFLTVLSHHKRVISIFFALKSFDSNRLVSFHMYAYLIFQIITQSWITAKMVKRLVTLSSGYTQPELLSVCLRQVEILNNVPAKKCKQTRLWVVRLWVSYARISTFWQISPITRHLKSSICGRTDTTSRRIALHGTKVEYGDTKDYI